MELSLDKGLRVLLIKLNSRDSPQSVSGWLSEGDRGEVFALKLIIRCYYGLWSDGDEYARRVACAKVEGRNTDCKCK